MKDERVSPAKTAGSAIRRNKRLWSYVLSLAIIVALFAIGPVLPTGILSLLMLVCIYSIYAVGYDLVFGLANQASLGHALFFGLGGYGFVLTIVYFDVGVITATIIALAVGLVIALMVGAVVVRLAEAYFVIITLLFSSVFFLIANNQTQWTGGSDGLSVQLQPIKLLGLTIDLYEGGTTYIIVLAATAVCFMGGLLIMHSRIGLVWLAIRENENRFPFVGYNLFRYKLSAWTVGSMFVVLSGVLYAMRLRYVSSEFVSFRMSVIPIVWVLLGGRGTIIGPVIGVIIMTVFEYYASALVTNYLIIVGVLLILVMRWSPKGVAGYAASLLRRRSKAMKTFYGTGA